MLITLSVLRMWRTGGALFLVFIVVQICHAWTLFTYLWLYLSIVYQAICLLKYNVNILNKINY
jgi:hypothetical protein